MLISHQAGQRHENTYALSKTNDLTNLPSKMLSVAKQNSYVVSVLQGFKSEHMEQAELQAKRKVWLHMFSW